MTEDQSCNPLNQDSPDDGGLTLTRATYDLIRACFNDEIAWQEPFQRSDGVPWTNFPTKRRLVQRSKPTGAGS
jgi:hypothetical protein